MSSLIQSLEIKINGKRVQHINDYNTIYNMLINYSPEYAKVASKLHNNSDPSVQIVYDDITDPAAHTLTKHVVHRVPSASADINGFKKLYCIDDFIGFLNTPKSFYNTNSVGDTEIIITWASGNVLWKNAGALVPSYTITNIEAKIDGIDFRDEGYLNQYASKIENGGDVFSFKHYELYFGDELNGTKITNMRITESTTSLNKIFFSYLSSVRETPAPLQLGDAINAAGANTAALIVAGGVPDVNYTYDTLVSLKNPSTLNTSEYFRQSGYGMGGISGKGAEITFKIDGQDAYTGLNFINAYAETLKTMNLNYDNLHRANPAIKDLFSYEKDFYLVAFSTEHIGGYDPNRVSLVSGIDTNASSINLEIQVKNLERGLHANMSSKPVILTETTKILTIGAGRMVSIQD
jgi:hypothetical protein